MLRVPSGILCRLSTPRLLLTGTLEDMSFTGVSVLFPSAPKGSLAGSFLELPQITLKVAPVSIVRRWRHICIRFRVESIEQGEQRWRDLHHARWRRL